jgi:tetratricopeptide (TPR) repeat protein
MLPTDSRDPAGTEVRASLARILVSDEFRNSPNLSAFLAFIVERALEGRADTIKAYTVATQVLGRPVSFDPQADPIVRVEATRLRRALDRYYGHAGSGEQIRISIPRGTYVPVIGWRPEPDGSAGAEELIDPPSGGHDERMRDRGSRRLAFGIAASVMVAATAAGAGFVLRAGAPARQEPATPVIALARDAAAPPRARDGTALTTFATLLVPPLAEGTTGARAYAILLTDLLRSGLARFDDVAVVESPAEQPGGRGSSEDTYSLLGRVARTGNEHRIALRLRHEVSRQIVWSAEFVVPDARRAEGEEMRLMREIAVTLVSPGGVIARDSGSAKAAADPRVVPAACIVLSASALAQGEDATMREARGCLAEAARDNPRFAAPRAMQARLAVETWRTVAAPEPALLDTALDDARAAVKIAPQGARNYLALSEVLAARGDRAAAEEAITRALELNPYSSEVLAAAAARDIEAGRYAEGQRLMTELQEAGAPPAPWQNFYEAIANFSGEWQLRSRSPGQADQHPSGSLALLVAGGGADPATPAAALDVRRRIPAAATDPVDFAGRFALQPQAAEELVRRLKAAMASG